MKDASPVRERFFVDPDIRRARTLAANFYTDPKYFELSKEKIFARSWQFVNAEPGHSLTPFTMLPGFLDAPLLIADDGERRRCLSNVCTHRGKVLIDEPCAANLIRCGYHGRRFGLNGKFLSMPEFEDVADFPSAEDDLTEIDSAGWLGFSFASLSPDEPFETAIADVRARFDDVNADRLVLAERREYEVNAHWALYCENYLEGFHIPFVHKGLNDVIDYGSYTTETFRRASLQTGWESEDAKAAGESAARYLYMFPNTMLNFYPWGISVNVVRPLTPERTIVEFLTYVGDPALRDSGAGADLHGVELEDEAVVESVQRGIRSRFYSRGRYSPTREQGTHHFHQLIVEYMDR